MRIKIVAMGEVGQTHFERSEALPENYDPEDLAYAIFVSKFRLELAMKRNRKIIEKVKIIKNNA